MVYLGGISGLNLDDQRLLRYYPGEHGGISSDRRRFSVPDLRPDSPADQPTDFCGRIHPVLHRFHVRIPSGIDCSPISQQLDAGSRRQFIFAGTRNNSGVVFAALAVLSGVPITVMFLVGQKYIVGGLTSGGSQRIEVQSSMHDFGSSPTYPLQLRSNTLSGVGGSWLRHP